MSQQPAKLLWVMFFAAMCVLVWVLMALARFPAPIAGDTEGIRVDQVGRLLATPLVLFYTLGIFFYVGGEVGTASWIVKFFDDVHHIGGQVTLAEGTSTLRQVLPTLPALVVALFWGLQGVGRLISGAVLNRLGSRRILRLYSFLSLACLLVAVFGSKNLTAFGFAACGFFTSVLFTLIFSGTINSFSENHGTISGLLCSASIGGTVMPPIVGLVGDHLGMQAAMVVPALCLAYVLGLSMQGRARYEYHERQRGPRSMPQLIVGIDIGGTKIAGGLVNQKGRLVKSLVVPTRAEAGFERSYGQIVRTIERLIQQAGGKQNILGIGICAPGPLNPKTGLVINPPNLHGWRNVPLAKLVGNHFRLPAKVENDANAAGLAEVLFGAAVGCRHIFYVTVSTGIGTGIIIDKKIYHGKNGVAGEGGHVSIDYHSPYRCGCGTVGCIEALAAGPGMARRARVLLEQEHAMPSLLRDMTKGDLGRISPELIEKASRQGDRIARTIIDETGFYLGVWLGSMISLFDPEAIVIGGGVSRIGKPLFDKIRQTIPHYTINRQFAKKTPLLPAKLKTNVGVFGAASLFLASDEVVKAS